MLCQVSKILAVQCIFVREPRILSISIEDRTTIMKSFAKQIPERTKRLTFTSAGLISQQKMSKRGSNICI
jgi:hypothetical protein